VGNQNDKVSVEEAFKYGKERVKKGGPDYKDGNAGSDWELDPFGPDADGDGVADKVDNCVFTPNTLQENLDDDAVGDACDLDDDQDEWLDDIDNCPVTQNPDEIDLQRDLDLDGLGDPCDPDVDGDGTPNGSDADDDNDGVPDGSDNCATVPNGGQANVDGDGFGDACDPDDDGDGFDDVEELDFGSNPVSAASTPEFVDVLGTCDDSLDHDQDGPAVATDPDCQDGDADGVPDARDNCVSLANGQLDFDEDAEGDDCDVDDDSDGCADTEEAGLNPSSGGTRNPFLHWDFFDVPTPPAYTRNKVVSVADIAAVVTRFGSARPGGLPDKSTAFAESLAPPPAPPTYHAAYDRTANGTLSGPPDGAIAIADIGRVVSQFGHNCTAPP
jgi:hypothetical protein